MSLDKILSISGRPGLYQLKTQTRSGFLVESIVDNKKFNIGRENNVNILSEISIYTEQGEKPLAEIFETIAAKEDNKQIISHKEEAHKLISYFAEILPDYNREKVYLSDIKKVINWYNLLISKNLILRETEQKQEQEAEIEKLETK